VESAPSARSIIEACPTTPAVSATALQELVESGSAPERDDAMLRLLLVCCGGAFGTGVRYLLGGWIAKISQSTFPFGTFSVNLIGSFAIGLVMALASRGGTMSETTRLVLVTGVLGGFTTYSAFNYETIALIREGATGLGLLNVGATLVGCLVAGTLGAYVGTPSAS
jgi:CrcB protein